MRLLQTVIWLGVLPLVTLGQQGPFATPVAPFRLAPATLIPDVHDLKDDDIANNARRAADTLFGRDAEGLPVAALEKALASADPQWRDYAVCILSAAEGYTPSHAMFEASMDGLGRNLKLDRHVTRNALYGPFYFLDQHIEQAIPYLVRGMVDKPPECSVRCAFLLAKHNVQTNVDEVVSVLVRHLADNKIPGDAKLAKIGLQGFGEMGVRKLTVIERTQRLDAQQRRGIEFVRKALGIPVVLEEPQELTPLQVRNLIEDFRHNRIPYDAIRARSPLQGRTADQLPLPILEAAMQSDDPQYRNFCLAVLQHARGYQPSDAMIAACVEALKDDDFPRSLKHGGTLLHNASGAVRFLEVTPTLEARHLQKALDSDDGQQRFLSAYLLARRGAKIHKEKIIKILVHHLKDNRIVGDAHLAGTGLAGLGEGLREPFKRLQKEGKLDAQQKLAIELLLADLDERPVDLAKRKKITSNKTFPGSRQRGFDWFSKPGTFEEQKLPRHPDHPPISR